jgi:WD40-like Beta Propeller Repeat
LRLLTSLVLGMTTLAAAPAGPPTPIVFEPGIISGVEHDAALAFTPDGRGVYFQRSDGTDSRILVSRLRNGRWSEPEVAPFSGRWSDMEPAMAADGSHIIFISNRPIVPGGQPIDGFFGGQPQPGGGGNLWRVDRTADGWSEPYRLPETVNVGTNVFAPSILRDGSLLFMRSDPTTGKFRIYRSQHGPDGYATAGPMPFSTGAVTDVDPVADRDETFIIFGSGRPPAKDMDLFIVRRSGAGWGTPQHLGPVINAPGSDAEPRLSADEKQLYFSSERRLADAKGVAAPGDWNNGKYNIWTIDLGGLPVPIRTRS